MNRFRIVPDQIDDILSHSDFARNLEQLRQFANNPNSGTDENILNFIHDLIVIVDYLPTLRDQVQVFSSLRRNLIAHLIDSSKGTSKARKGTLPIVLGFKNIRDMKKRFLSGAVSEYEWCVDRLKKVKKRSSRFPTIYFLPPNGPPHIEYWNCLLRDSSELKPSDNEIKWCVLNVVAKVYGYQNATSFRQSLKEKGVKGLPWPQNK